MSKLEILVLGPLQVLVSGRRLLLDGPITESLLATLVVDADKAVTVEALVDIGWESDPPLTVRRQIGNRLARLRKQLLEAGFPPTVLGPEGNGFVLRTPGVRVDLTEFHRLVLAGDGASSAEAAIAAFREALGLWRGPAFAGLESRRLLAIADHLGEQRLSLWERCLALRLQAGQDDEIVADLVGLHGMYPTRERFAWLLMLALYRCGRGAEALTRYHQTRHALAEELGVEPGRELRELFERILADDATLAHQPTLPAGHKSPSRLAPALLPSDVYGFTGRADELASLDAVVAADGEQPPAVVISAVSGTAGVGKTALAVHWARRVRDRFPDGQLYINLRGFDPAGTVMVPAEATRRFLDALGVPPQRIPADPDAQTDLYRTLLADKRMLVVLDNARDPDQIRPLLPGAPGCLVLVTSRNRLAGLIATEGARTLPLDLLTADEARELLTRRLGPARITAEPDAVADVIARCARLPLALAIVAANAAADPHLPLTAIAGQLSDTRDRLDALSTNDSPATDVRAVFSWSYQTLSKDSARLFRLLGLHPGPDISTAAVASLAALPVEQVRPLLNELAHAHLITEHTPGRYTLHDLLRAYAADLAHTTDPDQQRHAATCRVLDHYLHTAHTADRLLDPARDALTLTPPQRGVTPEHPADHGQALDWFTAEHSVLLAAVDHAAGFDTHTWPLAWTLTTFLSQRGRWHDLTATQRAAVAAAGRLGDPAAQARAHRHLARAHTRLGHLDDAHTQLRHALDLYRQADNLAGQAHAHLDLAHVWERQGRHAEALDHAEQALNLFRTGGHQRGHALGLNAVGWYHALLGDHQQALTYCQQALTLQQELGDRVGQARTWDSLGYAHHHLGHHTQAITCYQHAIDLYRDLGDRNNEATTLTHLGDTYHAADNPHAARTAWQQALTILDQLDHPDADQVRAKLHHLDQTPEHEEDHRTA